jgi:hypothetical protein
MASNLISTTTKHLNVVLRNTIKRTMLTSTTSSTTVRKYCSEPPADPPAVAVGALSDDAPTVDIPQDQAAFDDYISSYKNPGYFEHDEYSYFDYEHRMAPDRIPQPSSE